MLVLSRKVGQKILIGDQIAVTVVRVAQGTVRIGIEAPAISRSSAKNSRPRPPKTSRLRPAPAPVRGEA